MSPNFRCAKKNIKTNTTGVPNCCLHSRLTSRPVPPWTCSQPKPRCPMASNPSSWTTWKWLLMAKSTLQTLATSGDAKTTPMLASKTDQTAGTKSFTTPGPFIGLQMFALSIRFISGVVPKAGITGADTVGCYYLSVPLIPAFDTTLLICCDNIFESISNESCTATDWKYYANNQIWYEQKLLSIQTVH